MSLYRSQSSPQGAKRLRMNSSYHDAPISRDHRSFRFSHDGLCNRCKRPGHFARDCPNMTVCNNCGLPGHIAAGCHSDTVCWNCKEPGHHASHTCEIRRPATTAGKLVILLVIALTSQPGIRDMRLL